MPSGMWTTHANHMKEAVNSTICSSVVYSRTIEYLASQTTSAVVENYATEQTVDSRNKRPPSLESPSPTELPTNVHTASEKPCAIMKSR